MGFNLFNAMAVPFMWTSHMGGKSSDSNFIVFGFMLINALLALQFYFNLINIDYGTGDAATDNTLKYFFTICAFIGTFLFCYVIWGSLLFSFI